MNVFFISDLHLGHENMAIKRGFKNAKEMWQLIKKNWNAVTNKHSVIYILGDVGMEKSSYYHLLSELKGIKYVVLGNHEMRNHIPELLKYVNGVAGMIKYKKKIFLTHCPIHPSELEYRVLHNIHGHLHEKNINDSRYINVSCEMVDYTPRQLSELIPNVDFYKD